MKTMKAISAFKNFLCKNYSFIRTSSRRSYCRTSSAVSKDKIVKSQFPDVEIPNQSLDEFILHNADTWINRTATECAATGRGYTYGQMMQASYKLAQAFCAQLGLKKGDVLAIMLPNVPEYATLFLGCFRAGLIVTTINPIYTVDEVSRQLTSSEAKAVVTLAQNHGNIQQAVEKVNANIPISIITIKDRRTDGIPNGAIDFGELCSYNGRQTTLQNVTSDDTALLAYSSGTSGLPKAVQLLHRNIVADLCMLQHEWILLNRETSAEHQDVVPVISPIFHCYGMIPILFNMLSQGVKCVTLPKYRPETHLDLLVKYPVNVMHLVPPIVITLCNDARAKREHLAHVHNILSAAAPLAASDVDRFHDKFGHHIPLVQAYGLTETGPVTHLQRLDKEITAGSVGWNLSRTECRVVSVDDEFKNLGPKESGHLLLRGPQIMPCYYNNPEATADAFDKDGWFRSGDVAYYDEDGQFFITDRIKELIKVKGFQVAPAEIEALLRDHPDIADAAVTSIPHLQHGEAPKAFVVKRKGSSLRPEQVQEYVKVKAAKYKQLTGGVVFTEDIPKTSSGKILRRVLKQM